MKELIVVAPYDPIPRHLKTPLATEYGAIALLEAFGFPGVPSVGTRLCLRAGGTHLLLPLVKRATTTCDALSKGRELSSYD